MVCLFKKTKTIIIAKIKFEQIETGVGERRKPF